jgi:hypothetical protein
MDPDLLKSFRSLLEDIRARLSEEQLPDWENAMAVLDTLERGELVRKVSMN